MTRHTPTTTKVKARLALDVEGERNEESRNRHEWYTELRLGELKARGANVTEAKERLLAEVHELLNSDGARAAVLSERQGTYAEYLAARASAARRAAFNTGDEVEVRLPGEWLRAVYMGQRVGSDKHRVFVSADLEEQDLEVADADIRPIGGVP